MFYLKQHQPSGARLVEHPDWRLFFLPPEGVERFLFEAHQRGLLEYHAAGSVTRLSFPAPTLEEYAHVLAQRGIELLESDLKAVPPRISVYHDLPFAILLPFRVTRTNYFAN